eukprot:TRINITY_DN19905_c0_g1_i1.p2 TRINITY_DN19905_c0_g1~~TRINITY_DN19905_c0_g1_i1.p2  ORF type:complete len:165 (+),score=54.64 TRINITY_DN19905_c0_g1_i1:817-1311(+)
MVLEVQQTLKTFWTKLHQQRNQLQSLKSHSPVLETVQGNRKQDYNITWLQQELDVTIGDQMRSLQNDMLKNLSLKRDEIRHLRINVSWVSALSAVICTIYWSIIWSSLFSDCVFLLQGYFTTTSPDDETITQTEEAEEEEEDEEGEEEEEVESELIEGDINVTT